MPHDLTRQHSADIVAAANTDLEKQFAEACHFIAHCTAGKTVPNEDKLKLYGYFKQSHEGDVKGSQPWAIQVEARLKYDEWKGNKGMSHEEAAQAYIDEVEAQKVKYGLVLAE